jgi:hypothetical protein
MDLHRSKHEYGVRQNEGVVVCLSATESDLGWDFVGDSETLGLAVSIERQGEKVAGWRPRLGEEDVAGQAAEVSMQQPSRKKETSLERQMENRTGGLRVGTSREAVCYEAPGAFSVGSVKLDFRLACWAPEGIPDGRIHRDRIQRTPFPTVPSKYVARFKELEKDAEDYLAYRGRHEKKPTEPRDERFNGKAYSLINADWWRVSNEDLHLRLDFRASDYIRRRATRNLFLLPNGVTQDDRDALFQRINQPSLAVDERYCGGFGVLVAIVTSDNKLVFLRRSRQVAGDIGAWDCSCVEASALNDDYEDRSDGDPPSPYRNAERALWQEIGLRAAGGGESATEDRSLFDRDCLRLHALGCRTDSYEWAMYGMLDLRRQALGSKREWSSEGLSRSRLDADQRARSTRVARLHAIRTSRGPDAADLAKSREVAPDVFESDLPAFTGFDPASVAEFVCTHYVNDYSIAGACLALMAGTKTDKGYQMLEIDPHFKSWHSRNAELQKRLNTLQLAHPPIRTDGHIDRDTWKAITRFWVETLGKKSVDLVGITEDLREEIMRHTSP